MRLLVSSLALITFITLSLSQSSIDWISDWDYDSFQTSFYLLDYNQDGMVTLNEAKLGILSILDAEYLSTQYTNSDGEFSDYVYSKYHTFQPNKYNCIPSLIAMDFVDCLVMSVRHSTTTKEDAVINFDDMLSLYFEECDDISPIDDVDTTCSMLVRESGTICSKDDDIFCQISCFKCTKGGHMLFTSPESQSNKQNVKLTEILSLRMESRSEMIALTGDHNAHMISRKMGPQQHADDAAIMKPHITRNNHVCHLNPKMKHINRNRFVFMSDMHIEPWYNPDGTSYISRFNDYSITNMFECRDNNGNILDSKTQCPLTGYSDPPITLFKSALHAWNMYARRPEESVLFFIGDIQAHSFLEDRNAIRVLIDDALNDLLYYFEPDGIYITPGNNDGPHNGIFTNNGDRELTDGWSEVLIKSGIVNTINMPSHKYFINDEYYDTVSLFRRTGYYMKPLNKIQLNYFVIVVNTNLGSLNPTQQMAFESDLAFVERLNGKVVILGHHPSVLENMIPLKYLDVSESFDSEEDTDDMILGVFSGHIHYFSPTNKKGFTTLPAMTQYAPYTAFGMGDIQDFEMKGEQRVMKKKIKLTDDNLLVYVAGDHELVDSHCWQ